MWLLFCKINISKGVKTDKNDPGSAANVSFVEQTKENLETRMAIVHGAVTTLSNIKRSNPAAKDLDMASNEITDENLQLTDGSYNGGQK